MYFKLVCRIVVGNHNYKKILFKDVHMKIFYNTDFPHTFATADENELPMPERQNNWEVTDFVFEIKRVENYPNFDKSTLVTRHGLTGF